MPELPEVETIKEDLRSLVVGSGIEEARVLDPALVEEVAPEEFARRLLGAAIVGARRRAKHLILELDTSDAAVFQLKIGGCFCGTRPATRGCGLWTKKRWRSGSPGSGRSL